MKNIEENIKTIFLEEEHETMMQTLNQAITAAYVKTTNGLYNAGKKNG
ncbi:MAG: hypothetical protein IMX04_02810 [Candidatus Carbobacillus altaicus]|nr:hypothetical protein [Candidatus Carbobacillus altaicus]